jgi:cytidylate kinase
MASGDLEGRTAGEGSRNGGRALEKSGAEGRSATRPASVEAFPRLITVAREFASGGARVAGLVAAELGLQLWDYELVSHLARKADVELSVMRDIDERRRDLIDDVIATVMQGARVSGSRYRALLARTVDELAERGGAVIVGRGANFLVRPEDALRVRVVCPLEERIERYARRSRIGYARAARQVRTKDRERERFARQLCGEHADDATHYDLTLSTADLSEEAVAQLVVTAYRARFGSSIGARRESAARTASL